MLQHFEQLLYQLVEYFHHHIHTIVDLYYLKHMLYNDHYQLDHNEQYKQIDRTDEFYFDNLKV